jgi:outer membrane protein assembly factor BamE (lipoprotein component of BamABCDE complex)
LILLTSCQFKDPSKTHGINALKNKEKILIINKSNKNDVIKLIGRPHSVSVISDDIWIYVERVLTKGELLELGRNVLIVNNSLVLKFDKYGILSEKKIYDLKDMNKIAYAKNETQNTVTDQSFVNKFLSSIKQKMYGKKKK